MSVYEYSTYNVGMIPCPRLGIEIICASSARVSNVFGKLPDVCFRDVREKQIILTVRL